MFNRIPIALVMPNANDQESLWNGMYISIGIFIPVIILMLWLYIRKKTKADRVFRVKEMIHRFSKSDPFWNEIQMRKLGKDMFHMVMHAWSKNDSKKIGPFLTDRLKKEWRDNWTNMIANGYVFVYNQIFVESVTVIGAQDFPDDSKDSFSVEISGYVKRYLEHKQSGTIVPKHGNELDNFMDIYTFVRVENEWLLNEIHPGAKFKDIFKVPI
jgi:predicted lipid-binding transport protein (Tim44 family)